MRHLANKHGVNLDSTPVSEDAVARASFQRSSGNRGHDARAASAGSTIEQGIFTMYFKSQLALLPSTHPQQ